MRLLGFALRCTELVSPSDGRLGSPVLPPVENVRSSLVHHSMATKPLGGPVGALDINVRVAV
jgi:hypothetical protein